VAAILILSLFALTLAAPGALCQDKKGTGAKPSAAQEQVSESDLAISEVGQAAAGTPGSGVATAPAVSTWDFVRMLLILAAVVGFIYLVFYLLKKGSGRKILENDLIRVLGSRSLSGSRALHLVEVGGGVFRIGSSDGGVALISEIKDKESLDALRLRAAELSSKARRSFQDVLSDIFKPAKRQFSLGDGIEALKEQRERLRKLQDGE
jgi:flagellar protein FliO/FliZ